eukprot:gene7494-8769_t
MTNTTTGSTTLYGKEVDFSTSIVKDTQYKDSTTTRFANEIIYIPANSVKYLVDIAGWKFGDQSNPLQSYNKTKFGNHYELVQGQSIHLATFADNLYVDDTTATASDVYYQVRLDGGNYVLSRANGGGDDIHAKSIDSPWSGFNQSLISDDTIVSGSYDAASQTFKSTAVFKALPAYPKAGTPAGKLVFVRPNSLMCRGAPCGPPRASNINNETDSFLVGKYDDPYLRILSFDGEWYRTRTALREMILQLSTTAAGTINTRSFVKLTKIHCPMFKIKACPDRQLVTYIRDTDRCLKPVGCKFATRCGYVLPPCPTGYQYSSFTSTTSACDEHFCEAWFL